MLADTELWRRVAHEIDEKRQEVIANMAKGDCVSHAEYLRRVGYLTALEDVEKIARDTFGKMSGTTDDEGSQTAAEHYEA